MQYSKKLSFDAKGVASLSLEQFTAQVKGTLGCNPACEDEEINKIYEACKKEAAEGAPAEDSLESAPAPAKKPFARTSKKAADTPPVSPEQEN